MGYLVLMSLVILVVVLVFLGEAFAIGLIAWTALHLARRRPSWYVIKIGKGFLLGALVGAALGTSLTISRWPPSMNADSIFFALHAGASLAGYLGLFQARDYFQYRLEAAGPPL